MYRGGKPRSKLTGLKVGRLEVKSLDHINKHNQTMWLCQCECGNLCVKRGDLLKKGISTSCGCLTSKLQRRPKPKIRIHGLTGTKTYGAYRNMLSRCYNPKDISYPNYGGRGIGVDPRWLGKNGLENFIADMGNCPPKLSLERINNNEGYTQSNCKWATRIEQARNMRKTRVIPYKGKDMSMAEAAELSGIKYTTLRARVRRGALNESELYATILVNKSHTQA